MVKRHLNPLKNNSFFVFGARGVGKSTFINSQFIQDSSSCWSLDFLDSDIEEHYRKNPKALESEYLAKEKKPEWIFLDEVQKIPKILDHVHRLIENHNQKFILSGSSARKLKRNSANLLGGRALFYQLFPFTFLELKNSFNLENNLNWGALPKIYFSESLELKKQLLKSYVQTYVKEEVLQEQLIRNLDPFREFLEVSAQMNGKTLNFLKIAKEVGVTDKTVRGYYLALEETYLGFFLPAFHRSIRKAQKEHPKFYYFDIGVKRRLDNTLGQLVTQGTSFYGDTFEHFVILQIYMINHYLGFDYRLSYFCSKEGQEIDLIISTNKTKEILVEIKSSNRIDEIEVNKLSRLSKEFQPEDIYYLSQHESMQNIQNVKCRHWQTGILEIFKIKDD